MQNDIKLSKYYEKLHLVLTIPELVESFKKIKEQTIGDIPITLFQASEDNKLVEIIYTEHELEETEYAEHEFFDPYFFLKNHNLTSFWESVTFPWNEKKDAQGIILLSFRNTPFGYAIIGDEEKIITKPQQDMLNQLIFEFCTIYVKILFFDEASNEVQTLKHQMHALGGMADVLHTLDVNPLLARIVGIGLKVVHAEVAAICLNDPETEKLSCKIEWGLTKEIVENIMIQEDVRLIDLVFNNNKPLLLTDFKEIEKINGNDNTADMKSLIALPLETRRQKLGVFIIVNPIDKESFDIDDISLLETALSLAAIGIENAMLHQESLVAERLANEMKIAQQIQQDFLPKNPPNHSNFKIAGRSWSCDLTGGDYFDFFNFQNSKKQTAVIVGDVSGHGVGSALIMAYTKALLQALLKTLDKKLPELFRAMNELLFEVTPPDLFMTFLLAIIDTEKKKLVYVSAGHDEPIILRANGEIEILESTGAPLGMFPEIDWEISKTIEFDTGDVIVFTTDGVWEARNKDKIGFSRERLFKLISKLSEKAPLEIINTVYQEVLTFAAPMQLQDDFTIVVCKAI